MSFLIYYAYKCFTIVEVEINEDSKISKLKKKLFKNKHPKKIWHITLLLLLFMLLAISYLLILITSDRVDFYLWFIIATICIFCISFVMHKKIFSDKYPKDEDENLNALVIFKDKDTKKLKDITLKKSKLLSLIVCLVGYTVLLYLFRSSTVDFVYNTLLSYGLVFVSLCDSKTMYISYEGELYLKIITLMKLIYISNTTGEVWTLVRNALLFSCVFLLIVTLKSKSFGDGDVVILFIIAVNLGYMNAFYTLILAIIITFLYLFIKVREIKLDAKVPFGPHLCLALMIMLLIQSYIPLYL